MKDNIDRLGIHLKVRDIEVSREFYESYLGFTPVFAYGDDSFLMTIPKGVATAPEDYRGVTYDVGGTPFEIADGHIAVTDAAVFSDPITSPKVSAMLRLNSLVPLLEGSDRRPTYPVCKYKWGSIEMVMRDPDGWVLVLVSPYSDEELENVRRFVDVEVVDAT